MNFFFTAHQHKGTAFIDALQSHGAKRVRRVEQADFVLVDFLYSGVFSGVNGRGKLRDEVIAAQKLSKPIFLYPHSYSAALPYDLEHRPIESRAFFVPAPGFAEVLQRISYPSRPVEVGWTYSDVSPFEPYTGEKPKVLFAPLHPVGGGLPDCEREINAHAFELLVKAKEAGEIESLLVRFYGDLAANGLRQVKGVQYHPALLNGSTKEIEAADVIVSAGTHAYMSVALGKPTLMLGQDIRPHNSPRGGGMLSWVKNWELYRELVSFPYSVEMTSSLDDLLATLATAATLAPAKWKENHIGRPFDPTRFTLQLEELL